MAKEDLFPFFGPEDGVLNPAFTVIGDALEEHRDDIAITMLDEIGVHPIGAFDHWASSHTVVTFQDRAWAGAPHPVVVRYRTGRIGQAGVNEAHRWLQLTLNMNATKARQPKAIDRDINYALGHGGWGIVFLDAKTRSPRVVTHAELGEYPLTVDERESFLDGYLGAVMEFIEGAMPTRNPARRPGHPLRNPGENPDREAAVDKYREFWRVEPTAIGEFAADFKIPRRARKVGPAKWVTYRSGKTDPETLKKPRRPVDYIHHHDKGVTHYITTGAPNCDVPEFLANCQALTLLGQCLGYEFQENGVAREAQGVDPLPELYTTPNGQALIVIQDKREILAMIWGGDLGVEGRGIVH